MLQPQHGYYYLHWLNYSNHIHTFEAKKDNSDKPGLMSDQGHKI